jgi:hypothetical protein
MKGKEAKDRTGQIVRASPMFGTACRMCPLMHCDANKSTSDLSTACFEIQQLLNLVEVKYFHL